MATRSVTCIVVVFMSAAVGCSNQNPSARTGSLLSEKQVLAIAIPALNAKMTPEYVSKYKPFSAELRDGVWSVFGSVPGGGPGGTPEAKIRDRDSKVLGVTHSQ